MIFTQSEIIAYNSVLDGKHIFGAHCKAPSDPDESYVQKTVDSLREKGFLDTDNNPNKLFALAVDMLQNYKAAKEHVFINKMRVALGDTQATILTQQGDGFDLTQTSKLLLFQSILLETPFLCQADSHETSVHTVSKKIWPMEVEGKEVGSQFWIQHFTNQIITQAIVLYHIADQGFIYDPATEQLTLCEPRLMRMTLLDMLGIQTESVKELEP